MLHAIARGKPEAVITIDPSRLATNAYDAQCIGTFPTLPGRFFCSKNANTNIKVAAAPSTQYVSMYAKG
jgi:hypothetical protein